jgi:type IV pilus assembly protein PilW
MKQISRDAKRMSGFSLVELMVALTIGLIILSAVSLLFVNSKKTYTTQDRLARLQENARFAMQFLVKDLRLTGYYGCISEINADTVNNTLGSTAFAYDAQVPLEGANNISNSSGTSASGTWYPSGSTTMPATDAADGTDVIAIRMADANSPAYLTQEMSNVTDVLNLNTYVDPATSTPYFNVGDIVMMSDCASADIMQVSLVNTTSPPQLGHSSGLSKAYSPSTGTSTDGTRVMKFTTRQYFIATGASGNPALFRKDLTGNPVELVDGIESLQVLYGKDTDNDKVPNVYLKAGDTGLQSAADWASVVSVRVGILARTVSAKDTDVDTTAYDVDGDCPPNTTAPNSCFDFTAPGDHNKRRIFQATVQLRNKR